MCTSASSVVLNVMEVDRMSLLPGLFGDDFLIAELLIHNLAKEIMTGCSGEGWHYICLPKGGGYMMPDGDNIKLIYPEKKLDRYISPDVAGIILTLEVLSKRSLFQLMIGNRELSYYMTRQATYLWQLVHKHPEQATIRIACS